MLYFELLGTRYKLKTDWKEITLREAVKLAEVQLPQILLDIAAERATHSDVTFENQIKDFPVFFKGALGVLSDVDLSKLNDIEAEMLFKNNITKIVAEIQSPPVNGEYPECRVITIDGVDMCFPDDKNILGMDVHMATEITDTMVDVASLYAASKGISEGNFKYLSNMLSILMRPRMEDGTIEQYDADQCIARAEKFMDVSMDKVWGVFFYLFRSLDGFSKCIQTYTEEVDRIRLKSLEAISGTTLNLSQPTTNLKNWKGLGKAIFTKPMSLLTKK